MEHDTYTNAAASQPTDYETSDSSVSAPHQRALLARPGLWVRIAAFTLLANTALFFRGCSLDSTVDLTSGFPMPAVEFTQEQDDFEFQTADLSRALGNLGVCILIGLFVAVAARRAFFSSELATGFLLTYAAFNLILISPELWAKTVFRLQVLLLDLLFENERRIWVMDAFSRCYFVASALVVTGLAAIALRGWRRHIATSSERWWQFGLTGIFVLTTIACVLTAAALTLFARG